MPSGRAGYAGSAPLFMQLGFLRDFTVIARPFPCSQFVEPH